MSFLRFSISFAFVAISIARAATCNDFEIFANKASLGCDAVVSTRITYGNTLTLSISPISGDIKWKATDIVVIGTGSTYTPILTENSNKTITYYVERNGVTKTINVHVQMHPGYTVSFNTDGGTPSISPKNVQKDSLVKKPTETLTKTGYNFDGWNFDFNTPITKDTTIKAKWKAKTYTVSFNTSGGSSVASQKVNYNSTVSVPTPAPTKVGQNFDGWDFDFSTLITKDTTIKVKWKEKIYAIDLFVKGTIEFENSSFDLDTALSDKHHHYFIGGQSVCKTRSTKISITIKEPDIILQIDSIPQKSTPDKNSVRYEIPFDFGKYGLDTLIYELISKDGLHNDSDTLIIETPVPFEPPLVMQKWNSILFVNNNPKTNGGYKFKSYKWFKNDSEVGNSQFYSAAKPGKKDTLNIEDIYKVVMRTENDIKLFTCEGKAKIDSVQPPKITRKRVTKQVLGIQEKSLNNGSKIYNLNGKLTEETPAGVYIVEE